MVVASVAGGPHAASAAAHATSIDDPEIIPGSYVVGFKRDATSTASTADLAKSVAKFAGGSVEQTYPKNMQGFELGGTPEAAARASELDAVEFVIPARRTQLSDKISQPHPTEGSLSWGLDRIDQADLPLNQKFNPNGDGSGVTVYVIDSGVRDTNQDFSGRVKFGPDFSKRINSVPAGVDCNGHGTHVAGTIGGKQYGVARAVNIVSIKTQDCAGSGSSAGLDAAFNWIQANAKGPSVVNLSVVYPKHDLGLERAAQNLIDAGITLVAGAGNGDTNGPIDACERAIGSIPKVITVSASDAGDSQVAEYDFGNCIDLYAPGFQITSDSNGSDAAYEVMDGTSMAAPHVTGAAAIVLQRTPKATPVDVAQALTKSAVQGKLKMTNAGPNLLLQVPHAD